MEKIVFLDSASIVADVRRPKFRQPSIEAAEWVLALVSVWECLSGYLWGWAD